MDERARAEAAAAQWWQLQPFPQDGQGHPYLCSRCGSPIAVREGTSRVGVLLLCGRCTDTAFPRSQPPPAPASAPDMGVTAAAMPAQTAPVGASRTPPAPNPPSTPPSTGPSTGRRRPAWPWIVVGSAAVVVMGLIVALLVWAPWNPSSVSLSSGSGAVAAGAPGQPTLVSANLTAGTVVLTWTAPSDGPAVESYVVVRDGVEVATVDGTTTQYVDSGLVPGEGHEYRVLAEANDQRSSLSAFVTVTAPAPSPELVRVTERARWTLTLSWAAPPGAPQPDRYSIVDSATGAVVMSVDGTQTSAKVAGLAPGTGYAFQVVAEWGTHASEPSAQATAETQVPAVKAARLAGAVPLTIKVTSTPGGSLARGERWTDTWTFKPVCQSGACDAVLKGDITPPGTARHSFTLRLDRSGAVYTGQTRAHITHCGKDPAVKRVANTVAVRLRVTSAHVVNGEWVADAWAGTLTLRSPYTTAGIYYCPAQTVTLSLTGR